MTDEALKPVNKEAAASLMQELKPRVREIMEEFAMDATMVAKNSPDPHGPIIGCMQLAIAQASAEYLLTAGLPPQMAVQLTCELINSAMNAWVGSFTKKGTSQKVKPVRSKIIRP